MNEHSTDGRRETTDVSIGGIAVFIVVLIVAAVLIHGGVFVFYRYLERSTSRPGMQDFPLATTSMQRLPPEPRLQTDPRGDLATLRQSEDAVLNSYAWVDRNAGIVRVPIELAMKLTAERGLPTR